MSTSARLILLLTLAVGAVMATGGFLLLRQRVGVLEEATRNEARAHANTLQLVLEHDYQSGRLDEVQQLINRLSEFPKIYGVIVFDEKGEIALFSDPLLAEQIRNPPQVERAITTGEAVESVRRIAGEEVFSIIRPLRLSEGRRGAFEVAQPRALIEADLARARRTVALMTLSLFAAVSLAVLAVMRRSFSRPIGELLVGAEAVGEGDLDYRVIVPRGGSELARLARAFNRMADRLNEQRRQAGREAEGRLVLARELRQHERLASLGRLAAGVAHEMGAPLSVIKGRVEQLLGRIEREQELPRERIERNLTIISEQADAIARIVRQLLDLARPYKLQRAPVEISRLIARTVEMLRPEAERRNIAIEAASGDGTKVEIDADLIHQVLVNICLNGIQAIGGGGRLRLVANEKESVRDARAYVTVSVIDSGPGVAPENVDQIFDPFFTTKEVGQGTGLGLTVSRRIVEEHGGWITVENGAGGGAVFTVYLPKAEGETTKEHEE